MRAYRAFTRVELIMFLREPFAVFFTLVLPVGLQLIFGAAFGKYEIDGVPTSSLQLAGIALMVASYLGLMGIPIVMAEYRELGVLRAFRIVPARFSQFILAHVTVEVLMFTASLATCFLATAFVFGIVFHGSVVQFGLVLAATLVMFLALGFAISSIGASARTSQAIGASLYFLSLFTSGAAIPREQMPDTLRSVLDKFPSSILLDRLQNSWTGTEGWGPSLAAVAIALCIAAAAVRFATKRFDQDVSQTS